ncbi:MAG: 2-oxo acid dehydrogenase subunit E2 [Erythrobacter sp.]|uniref:2-oxo acid dehydrogenase subunit E2 n=1 Tax=Erythrobacter sp. TaxID=1042 RepID=UPI00329A785B
MAIELKMPALSPTMEEGTLARWLVKVGDEITSGDIMAEIETDKATMEFEAVDEGVLAAILIEEGAENVAVGTVIAMLAEEGEDIGDVSAPSATTPAPTTSTAATPAPAPETASKSAPTSNSGDAPKSSPLARRIAEHEGVDLNSVTGSGPKGRIIKADVEAAVGGGSVVATAGAGDRVIASPLAKKLAGHKGIDLGTVTGTGPGGRIVKADIDNYVPAAAGVEAPKQEQGGATKVTSANDLDAPYEEQKLNNVRKVIARRLTEAKQTVPHIYLTVDIRLDPLLAMRKQLNEALEADGVKLSVNDLIIKALARALTREPQCNVSFQGDVMHQYSRADISVAVAAPSGLITPIIRDAGRKSLSEISAEMKELAGKAREGKLKPHEYQGGTASLSNLGMFGTKQFDAVINPPQGMILAVGAGEQRPHVVDGELTVATVMSATGSFDHRAIDGVDGAKLMDQLRTLIENPMGLVV